MIQFRPNTADDIEVMAHIERLARTDGWSHSAILDTLQQPHSRCWVSIVDGQVIGHVLSRVAGDEAEILTIAVRPNHQRCGAGRTLLNACFESWQRDGVQTAFLEVRASNHGARALYAATGWLEAGVRHGYYRDGEAAIVMRWGVQCS